ncbi:hypothetical protein CCP2SC5_1020003 [Azospirillaceae bacterium]
MRGSLHFTLPQEQKDFELAQNALKYKIWTDDFDDWLRQKIKYENVEQISVQEVRDKLWEIHKETFE